MRTTRTVPARPVLIVTVTLATAGSLLLGPDAARADPKPVTREGAAVDDRAAEAPASAARRALAAKTPAETSTAAPARGYPRRQVLSPDPENPGDKSLKLGLTPYHAIAPKLNALQRLGDRVSVEVTGRSAGGHRLYLVTVTAPETTRQARAQERMRELIEKAPAAAANSPGIKHSYKTPVFVNSNIHGNEWEGTDASLKIVEQLATAKDARTRDLLAHSRLYFNITANPDGRIAGTRANANGFDLNRDFVTASQPETRAMRQIELDKQPAVLLDLHGYVNGTLIEPTTPPHGENYEYDLFLKNSYANALGMESAVNALGYTAAKDGVEPVQIPFRDQEEGWDDWPPIFTPQYAAFHGTVAAHTVEIPLAVNNEEYDELPVPELRRRSAVNTAVAGAAIRATLDHVREHRTSLLTDQIEVFRRGAAGAPQVPVSPETVPGVPGIGPEDVYTTTFPRAYVIPPGDSRTQRSAPAVARLVDHLLANDVRVSRATRPFRLAGRTYPRGSYVVDMHQPKRGMANTLLADGRDISGKVSVMYDISGWSLGRLWGATVEQVPSGSLRGASLRPVTEAAPVAHVPGHGNLRLRLTDPREIAALNSLLRQGVAVRQGPDGSAIVPASARREAIAAARTHDVSFTATRLTGGTPLHRLRVAAAVTPGELFALREMNFDVTPVSTAVLNAGFDWSGTDVLFVSAGLDHAALTAPARRALDAFLDDHGLVGRGARGAALNAAADRLAVMPVEGNTDANGVVRTQNTGRVTHDAPAHAFVYAPLWFTGLGPGVRVEQSYATGNPLVSGHWRPLRDGTGGPAAAAGQASVVSGGRTVLFGTEPLFRDHPKGEFPQVARALFTVAHSGSVEESG
ncbi:M14 family zinc carboxypeptidase [Streptomyces coeruleorubidus]|uniref:M14 family zinc carboxypeptidase n=1 Tax=Streptomyces coeruleorubidus TaxID=116188 RepID=UPI00237F7903|nr:M14 family zinc carboxypeptidase [Streptomyces coeruleorubidus]WDV51423.1 M14 family zinc carboxypeptidase [Streptomyces coeruleorubidus]